MSGATCYNGRMLTMRNPMPGDSTGIELLNDLRPYLRQCGESLRPAWQIGARKLLDFLLVHIGSGQGRFFVDTQWYDAEEGDLFWIPPDTVHEMSGDPPAMYCTYLHFDLRYRPEYSHWDFSIPGGFLDLSDFTPLLHPPLPPGPLSDLCGRIRGATNSIVGHLMHQVCAIANRGQAYTGIRTAGLLLEIVAEILRGQVGLEPAHSQHIPGLDHAAAFLFAECRHSHALRDAAEIAGLSESHFRKLFGIHYGCSPREYLRRCRIQRAKQLMMSHQLTLTQIAAQCGFATVHSFSRAFHDSEGIPPTEYRRVTHTGVRVEGLQVPYAG